MNAVVVTADVVSMIAFSVAAGLALFTHYETPLVSKRVRYVFVGAMALYAFVSLSNVLEHAGITAAFDVYEDFAEILFLPAIAYVVSTMFQNQQLDAQAKAARVMRQQNDLLLNIVDTVPGGILVVGPTGAVTFANEGAERMLGMTSDTGGSVLATPNWVLFDPATAAETSLSQLASGGAFSRRSLFAKWPDGTQTELVFSSTPMTAHGGELGGSIVAFEAESRRV
jgi:PAS domain-containing protein